jgi:hypothetical protein
MGPSDTLGSPWPPLPIGFRIRLEPGIELQLRSEQRQGIRYHSEKKRLANGPTPELWEEERPPVLSLQGRVSKGVYTSR